MTRPMTDEESEAHVRGLEDDYEADMMGRYEGAGDPGTPGVGDWFEEVYMGHLVDVIERKGRFSRTGVAFRGYYDDGQRIVRVQIRTAREADSYEVRDLADNWEVQS